MAEHAKPQRRLLLLLVAAGALGLPNCHLIFPYSSAPDGSYTCNGVIKEVNRTYPAPDPANQFIVHGVGQAEEVPFYNSDVGVLPNLYPNEPWKPTSDGLPWQLKGTHLVRVSSDNANFAGDVFLEVSLNADLQELLIGFDTRATSPPTWLTRDFERIPHVVVRSTQKYRPSGSTAEVNVEYALWHPTAAHRADFARRFTLGGNNAPGVAWRDDIVGAKYLTFLRPVPSLDQSKTQVRDAVQIEVCEKADNPQEALSKAEAGKSHVLDEWLGDPEHEMYRQARADGALVVELDAAKPCALATDAPTNPKTYKACAAKSDEIGSQAKPITSWPLRSRATIDPSTSRITVEAHGTTTTAPIRGRVSFRIDSNNQAEIDELTLFGDPLTVGGRAVDQLSLGQARKFVASCTDKAPPGPSRLCKDYSIPIGEAGAEVGATLDGKPIFLPLENSRAVEIHVDFNKRSFAMSGGPMRGELPTDDGPERVELWMDVTGLFDNLAPVASLKEMPARFQCVDANRATVHLDASASFDQDPGPGIVGYAWTEDAGLPTQRALGTSKSLDVKMNVGGHPVTLVVTDDRGAIDSRTILIDVFDPRIDHFQVPLDVVALSQDEHGAVVNLGDATASDGCSGAVGISNDAPRGLRFPLGTNTVEWTFDDYNGNVVHQPQKVTVVGVAYYPPPIAKSYVLHTVAADGSLEIVYVYGTEGQGRRMRADDSVLLRSPSGRVYAVDGSGRLVGIAEPRAERRTHGTFGKAPTQGFVALRTLGDALSEDGRYTISYVLTVPGGSPQEPRDVIARDDVGFDVPRR